MLTFPIPGAAPALGAIAEDNGFDGILFADTQNLAGDVYSELALVAKATSKLKLGTGVTNPVTRHPSVTATAIATLQVESSGRAVLGIGRGDSSLAYIGRPPATPNEFEIYLKQVQAYLRGDPVNLNGFESRNAWIANLVRAKVPLDVAATGPKVIDIGVRNAERVTFAVGASPARLNSAIETARRCAADAGIDSTAISFGAYVNVAVNEDISLARKLVRGGTASFAHFSGMRGAKTETLPTGERAVAEHLGANYDMAGHGMAGAKHQSAVPDDFVDKFAIAGPAGYCTDRLIELIELGLERIVVVAGSRDADPAAYVASNVALATEVIPVLKQVTLTT